MTKIPEWWIETTLKSVCVKAQNKINVSDLTNETYISTENMLVDKGWITTATTLPTITNVSKFYPWDILFSNIRTYFKKLYLSNFTWWCSNDVLIFRASKETDNKFLFYNLSQDVFFDYTVKTSKWTKMPRWDKNAIEKFPILLPPLQEQKAIAGVLSSFDDKIELLRAENQTLEEMGQTLFKERFGKYKVWDELPDWWKEYELSDLVNTVNWYSYKWNELVEKSNEALVTLKSFDRNWWFQTRWFKEFKWNPKKEHEVFVWDLIVAHTDLTQDAEVLGNPAFIVNDWWFEKLYITMDLVKVEPKNDNISKSFLYFLMKTREFKWHCVWYSNWTTVLHLSKKAIPEYKMLLPSDLSTLKDKSTTFDLIMKKISHNFSQINELSETRNQLLPKLMSWEVRVEF